MKIARYSLALILTLVAFTAGCGFLIDESRWEEGHESLSETVGNPDISYDGVLVPNYSDFVDFKEFIDQTDFSMPTGEWFDGGKLGYGVPSGTKKSGDDFEIILHGQDPNGVKFERDVRIMLHEFKEGYELGELLLEDEVYVETVTGAQEIYSNSLPEGENISYLVSVEVLDESRNVEDILLGLIYVPEQEVNARLSIDRNEFEFIDDEDDRVEEIVTLTLENFGPTFLSLGKEFTIEKLVQDTWRIAPVGLAFESIGINLGVQDSYSQTYDVSDLRRGTYRFVKKFHVDGMDREETLAVEFTVK